MPHDQDDALAEALAKAGLSAVQPGGQSDDDPLARAFAAAGLAAPAPEPDDPIEEALAELSKPASGPNSVVDRPSAAEGDPDPLPRWPDGVATGLGAMPGTDPREAAAIVVGEVPLMPALPELPARGVGADLIGRTAALLVDLAVELKVARYTVAAHSGRDQRRAIDLLRSDMDAFDEACDPVRPAWVKVAAAGPWTLVAAVELATGHRVITDRGAVREFTESLVEGLRQHVTEVAARSGATVVVQLDEPGLPAVLAGSLRTPSGYGTVRTIPEVEAQDVLREVVEALTEVGAPVVVHCGADRPPLRVLSGIGAAALGIDATLPSVAGSTAQVAALDAVGEVWDADIPLFMGLVPARDPGRPVTSRQLAQPAFDLADRLGFDRARLAGLAVPTPTAGLAGADPDWARRALELSRELGAAFVDPPDTE